MNSSGSSRANYDLILFDLDGTLIDSKLDLANSVNFTREQMGLSVLEHRLIFSYIGDGASRLAEVELVRHHMDWITSDGPAAILAGEDVTPPWAAPLI